MKSLSTHFEHDYVEIASETLMAMMVIGLAVLASIVAFTLVVGF